jgi:hypothetical protein
VVRKSFVARDYYSYVSHCLPLNVVESVGDYVTLYDA